MIILNKFVDVMEVIRIKVVAFYAEVFLNRFGKELRFVSISLGDFVCVDTALNNVSAGQKGSKSWEVDSDWSVNL